ncbi:endothelial PAS domain-containing protein 1-like [Ambystoma mexicanum]|uniref:endothelial PAS domain-containing protein 1-like n=1 Tax=Ambystoma mexicanum TaxID=8296 RepID=UPI0037E9734C
MSDRNTKLRMCSEKRREKSRNAARHRRSKESELFLELAQQLPLPTSITSQLDKASIMRLAISFMRLKDLVSEDQKSTDTADGSQVRLLLDALEGFLMVVSQTGEMLFLSENVNKHLGLTQVDMIGQSLFEYIHPCDEEEIREVLHSKHETSKKKDCSSCDFFARMKCTWASQERSPNLKPASWKVLHCRGQGKLLADTTGSPQRCTVLLCEPILFPCEPVESPGANIFLSRHTLDMKFTQCDGRIKELLGYSRTELQGRSVYDYCHALDTELIRKSHQNLLSKGQTSTTQYRMLSKHGGYIWIQTDATLVYTGRHFQAESVVCMNYILSEPVERDIIFSLEQTECFFKSWDLPSSGDPSPADQSDLLFTKLREHPEELAQLAPTPGDTIVMLDFNMSDLPSLEYPRDIHLHEERPPSGSTYRANATMERLCTEAACPAYPIIHSSPDIKTVSEQCYQQEGQTVPMDCIEKLFASPVDPQTDYTLQSVFKHSDLEMLAPYIPMEGEDFSLTTFCEDLPSSRSSAHAIDMPDFDTMHFQFVDNASLLEYSLPEFEKYHISSEHKIPLNQEVMRARPQNGKITHSWNTAQEYSLPFIGWPDVPWPPELPFDNSSSGALYGNWPPILGYKAPAIVPLSAIEGKQNIWQARHRTKVSSSRTQPLSLKRKLDLQLPALVQASEPLPEKTRVASEQQSAFKKGTQWFSKSSWEPPDTSQAYRQPAWQSPGNYNNMPKADLGHSLLGALPVLNNLDCEVNAPLQGQCRLLQGRELLRVLDQVSTAMQAAMAPAFLGSCHIQH